MISNSLHTSTDDYAYSPLPVNEEDEMPSTTTTTNNNSEDDDDDLLDVNGAKSGSDLRDFDHFLMKTVGEFGLYQQFVVWLLCIPACFLSAFSVFDMIFIAYTPSFNCSVDPLIVSNVTDLRQCSYDWSNGTSNISTDCTSFNYDKEYFQQSVVTQFDLVCDRALVARTIISLMNLATLVAVGYSYVQDKYGRKKAFLLNLTVFLAGSIGSAMARSPLTFSVLKFIGGISCMWEIGFVWALEFVGPSKRTLVTTMLSVIYGLANMSVALVAYLTQTWSLMAFCTSAPFAFLFSYAFIMPESPRWLLAEGRIDETLVIVERMLKWERKTKNFDSQTLRDMLTKLKVSMDVENAKQETTISVGAFFRSSNLMWKNFLVTFISVISNQLYYTVAYDSENLYPNFYVAYLLQAAVEVPATFLNLLLLNRFGRILPLSVTLMLSGAVCLLTWPMSNVTSLHIGVVVLTAMSRFFVCASVAIVEQLGGELYPTVGRGLGMSVSYVASSLVGLGAQYLIYTSYVWKVLPLLIMGSFTLLAGFLSLFLPETKGKALPDTVEQAEAMGAVGWKSFKRHFRCFTSCITEPSHVLRQKSV